MNKIIEITVPAIEDLAKPESGKPAWESPLATVLSEVRRLLL